MDHWTELLYDAKPIKSVYGSKLPELDSVTLTQMDLQSDGPGVLLSLDLHALPDHPPSNWPSFNRVNIKLMAWNVRKLLINGWEDYTRINLGVRKEEGLVHLFADNEAIHIDILSRTLYIQHMYGYMHE